MAVNLLLIEIGVFTISVISIKHFEAVVISFFSNYRCCVAEEKEMNNVPDNSEMGVKKRLKKMNAATFFP